MSNYKCKMCGGTIEFEEGATVGVCDSCGTKQTLPKTTDETVANLFNRANNLRLKSEFDKAEQIYEKIVQLDDSEAEAHWGIVLCKYGIEYVEDPKTFTRIPTCHRTCYDAVTSDPDYQAAIDYSDAGQQAIYESEARAIDRIQKDILAIVAKEEPFDVFICYKETDENGKRTIDSTIANDIYYQLTQEGFKVFYAAITLEDKLGQEYEPYIFAALHSAKVMLVIGTKPEYYSAIWVKNEWSRYLKLMKEDRSKLLIPCYRDMDAYDLPEEFAHLQAQDMSKIGFINDVVRGIKKVASVGTTTAPGVETVIQNVGLSPVDPLVKRAFIMIEDGEIEKADAICEQALNLNPECGEIYLAKLLMELNLSKREDLKSVETPFSGSNNYQKIMRYGSEDLKKEVGGYIDGILNEIEEGKRWAEDLEKECILIDPENKSLSEDIAQIKDKLGETSKKLDELKSILSIMDSVKNEIADLDKEVKNRQEKVAQLTQERSELGLFKHAEKKRIDGLIESESEAYRKAVKNLQNVIAKLKGYSKVSATEECSVLEKNMSLYQEQLNEKEAVTSPRMSTKDILAQLLKAPRIYIQIAKDYAHLKKWAMLILASPYDIVEMGEYGEKGPVKWKVLKREENRVLLISESALDRKPYHVQAGAVTWETCTLRKWLNNDFYSEAFSKIEKDLIITSNVSADKNPNYSTNPGRATNDKVFCLCINEVEKLFKSNSDRICYPTNYVKSKGVRTDNIGACGWWLRSPGNSSTTAADVLCDGSVSEYGNAVDNGNFGVRPALWVNLEP